MTFLDDGFIAPLTMRIDPSHIVHIIELRRSHGVLASAEVHIHSRQSRQSWDSHMALGVDWVGDHATLALALNGTVLAVVQSEQLGVRLGQPCSVSAATSLLQMLRFMARSINIEVPTEFSRIVVVTGNDDEDDNRRLAIQTVLRTVVSSYTWSSIPSAQAMSLASASTSKSWTLSIVTATSACDRSSSSRLFVDEGKQHIELARVHAGGCGALRSVAQLLRQHRPGCECFDLMDLLSQFGPTGVVRDEWLGSLLAAFERDSQVASSQLSDRLADQDRPKLLATLGLPFDILDDASGLPDLIATAEKAFALSIANAMNNFSNFLHVVISGGPLLYFRGPRVDYNCDACVWSVAGAVLNVRINSHLRAALKSRGVTLHISAYPLRSSSAIGAVAWSRCPISEIGTLSNHA